jgi:hypothetical protein
MPIFWSHREQTAFYLPSGMQSIQSIGIVVDGNTSMDHVKNRISQFIEKFSLTIFIISDNINFSALLISG